MFKVYNPATMAPRLGTYSNGIEIPRGARVVYIAGQVGIRPDGTIPKRFDEQAEAVWQNLSRVLDAAGMSLRDVVKNNTYLTRRRDFKQFVASRAKHLGTHEPASTLVYVSGLVRPELLIEIDAVAVCPRSRGLKRKR